MSKYHHSIEITKRIIYSIITKNNHSQKECWIPVFRHIRYHYMIVRLPLLVQIVNAFPVPYRTTQRCALLRLLWKLIMDMTTRILTWYPLGYPDTFPISFFMSFGEHGTLSCHRSIVPRRMNCTSSPTLEKVFLKLHSKLISFNMKRLFIVVRYPFCLFLHALWRECDYENFRDEHVPSVIELHRNNIQLRFKMKYLLSNLYFQNWYQ